MQSGSLYAGLFILGETGLISTAASMSGSTAGSEPDSQGSKLSFASINGMPLNSPLGPRPYNPVGGNREEKLGTAMNQRSLVLAAGLAMLIGAIFENPVAAQPRGILDFLFAPRYCGPLTRTVDGGLASPCGWRLRRDYGLDYTCFYAPYLGSTQACSVNGG